MVRKTASSVNRSYYHFYCTFIGGDHFEITASTGELKWIKEFTSDLDCIKDGIILVPITVSRSLTMRFSGHFQKLNLQ